MAPTRRLPPLTFARFVGDWHFDPWVAGAVAVLAAAYLGGVVAARRRGRRWPVGRTLNFVGLGLGSIVLVTMSSLGRYEHVLLWPAAVQLTALLAITPLCLGLADPLGLIAVALPARTAGRWNALLRSRPVRLLTFPVVGAVLATATQFLIFFTGYLGAAMRSAAILHVLQLQVVLTGCLFALPLLGVELLPVWVNAPLRMVFAGVDGLLDAVPGTAVIGAAHPIAGYYVAAHPVWTGGVVHDQSIAGGLMITLSELIALPFVAVLFRAWVREDAAIAGAYDAVADLPRTAEGVGTFDDAETAAEGPTDRPWWEVDPGPLADRARRYGWDRQP